MGEHKFAKYAFACISAEHLDKDGNLNVSAGEDKLVVNWGWFWKNVESDYYWNIVASETEDRVTDYRGEKVRIERFKTAPGMVYYIPGNGNGHIVSGITKEDYSEYGFTHIHVYYAGEDFEEAERVYNSMNKDEFYMLDLLSYDAKFAVKSTRRKIYA